MAKNENLKTPKKIKNRGAPAQAQRCTSRKKWGPSYDILRQLRLVLLPLWLFYAGGIVAENRGSDTFVSQGCLTGVILLALWILTFVLARKAHDHPKIMVKVWTAKHRDLLLVLVISLLLRLPQYGTMPTNDSMAYYQSLYNICQNFTFGLDYFINSFRLAAHPSYGFALLAAIPELFRPGNFNNIWLLQTTLSLLAIACVYDLLHRQKRIDSKAAAAGALAFSASSMFLGLDTYFQLDFGVSVAAIYVIWSFYRRKYILLLASALLLVLSKEFGITVLVGFLVGVFVYYLVCVARGSFGQRILQALREPLFLSTGIACLIVGVVLLWYLFASGFAWINILATSQERDETALAWIGWDNAYFFYKLKQLFTSNFFWLEAALLLFCTIWRRSHHVKPLPKAAKTLLAGCLGAGVLYFFFSCMLVTYSIYRYNLVLELLFCFATIIMLVFTFPKRTGRIVCYALAAVLGVQAYLTIDPIMAATNYGVRTGGWTLVHMGYEEDSYIGDYAIYNYQYTYLSRCLRKILKSEEFDEKTILAACPYDNGATLDNREWYGWDTEKQDWSMDLTNSAPIDSFETKADCTNLRTGLEIYEEDKDHIIVIFTPSLSSDNYETLRLYALSQMLGRTHNIEEKQVSDGIYGTLHYITADIGAS